MGRALLVLIALGVAAPAAQGGGAGVAERRKVLQHLRRGEEALIGQDWQKAEQEFRSAVERDRLQVMAHYGLARCFMAQKRYREAVEALRSCKDAVDELGALAHRDAAEMQARRDEEIGVARRQVQLLRSLRQPPPDVEQRVMRLEQYIRDLERQQRQEVARPSVPAPVLLSLGAAHFRLGEMTEAEREYLAAIDADPGLGEAHNNLAVLYLLAGRIEEASEEISRAEQAGFPVHPGLRDDLARARRKGAEAPAR